MKTIRAFVLAALAAISSGQDRITLLSEDFEAQTYAWSGSTWGNAAYALLAPGQCGAQSHAVAFTLPSTCNYSTGSSWFKSSDSPRFTAFSTSLKIDFDYELSMDPAGDTAHVALMEYTTMGGALASVPVADLSTLLNDGLPHHATFSVQLPKAGTQWYIWFGVFADGAGDLLPGFCFDNVVVSEISAVRSFCFGDITGAACPCGNSLIPAGGCRNSLGMGALLTATGSVSVATDDLVLSAQQMRWGKPALLIEGSGPVDRVGVPFNDGLLCLGPPLRRLDSGISDGSGVATFGPGIAGAAQWVPGASHYVQVWYRDHPISCLTGSNLTQALAISPSP